MLVHVDAVFEAKNPNEFTLKKITFHQNNAGPHVASFTDWALHAVKKDPLTHSPYSYDNTSSDFTFFVSSRIDLVLSIKDVWKSKLSTVRGTESF